MWNLSMNINHCQLSLSTLCCEAFKLLLNWRIVLLNPPTHTHTHMLWPSMPPYVVFSVKCFYTMLDCVYNCWRPHACTVQLFVLRPTFWSTQAVQDGLGGVNGWGRRPATTPHILHRTGKVRDEGLSGWRRGFEREPLSPLLLWGMIGSCPLYLWTQKGVKIQGDALTVFTVQPRLLILSPLSPPSVSSVITRGPQRFAILWPDRFLQRTWTLFCKNSELLSLLLLCSCSHTSNKKIILVVKRKRKKKRFDVRYFDNIDFLQLVWEIATLRLCFYSHLWVQCQAVNCLFYYFLLKWWNDAENEINLKVFKENPFRWCSYDFHALWCHAIYSCLTCLTLKTSYLCLKVIKWTSFLRLSSFTTSLRA